MAKKGAKRIRRNPEQIIADLEQQITDLRNRSKAKELKQDPSHKAAITVVRGLDKAIEAAKEGGNNALAHALADGREPIAGYFTETGLELPKPRRPRGRRAKTD